MKGGNVSLLDEAAAVESSSSQRRGSRKLGDGGARRGSTNRSLILTGDLRDGIGAARFDPESDFNAEQRADNPLVPDTGSAKPRLIKISPALKRWLHQVLNHLYLRMFVLLLIISDACLLIAELTVPSEQRLNEHVVRFWTWMIMYVLLSELSLRLIYMDVVPFFTTPWSLFDFFVTFLSFTASVVDQAIASESPQHQGTEPLNHGRYLVAFRLVKGVRFIRVFWKMYLEHRTVKAASRMFVSQNRRRYIDDEFDIDITYVTTKLIAMSVPAVALESYYRNPVEEVSAFFKLRHKDHYRLFNLCPERQYDYAMFDGRVTESFMGDHNPAPIHQLLTVCRELEQWLTAHPANVAAIHCKGGKGRTGTVLCAYLLYSGEFSDADEALDYFANRRTSERKGPLFPLPGKLRKKKREGVEARSQERFVRYIAEMCFDARMLKRKAEAATKSAVASTITAAPERLSHYIRLRASVPRSLKNITVTGITHLADEHAGMWFVVYQGLDKLVFDQFGKRVAFDRKNDRCEFHIRATAATSKHITPSHSRRESESQNESSTASSSSFHQHHLMDKSNIFVKPASRSPSPAPAGLASGTPTSTSPSSPSSPTSHDVVLHDDVRIAFYGITNAENVRNSKNMKQSNHMLADGFDDDDDNDDDGDDIEAQQGRSGSSSNSSGGKKKKPKMRKPLFAFWLNTAFQDEEGMRLVRSEIDGVRKCKIPERFPSNFAVHLTWQ